ncbi:DUF2807 domain-containing protein [Caulobacter sp. NIBR1757]|uniref:GIN domain-containing protein n=1 Tax=Caulobacter sp. NIBR1757 TaxID=3016000 RepID=UPI0022F009FB|nr:DUF2807 domain-containing protein [Caulobacter sp. NIBR1757]WGM38805.1 hypothetical protein AMEJIAPC_01712 [Caulobacter sp. NIBR1757]
MRLIATLGLAALAIAATAGAASAKDREPRVVIKNAVARVTVVPQDRADVQVVVKTHDPRLVLTVEKRGDRTIIDGDLKWNKIRNCRGTAETASADVRDVGTVQYKDMPEVIIYTPRDVDLGSSGAVWGYIGRANSVNFGNAGCGDWTIANVTGELDISQAGSGDVLAGDAGGLDLSVAGSGDIKLKAVTGKADISIAGSGNVIMGSLNGDLDVSIAGSGDIRIFAGRASNLDVSVAGSGDVRFAGEATKVDATFMGQGDLWVTKAGSVDKTVMGQGAVHVGPFEMKRD